MHESGHEGDHIVKFEQDKHIKLNKSESTNTMGTNPCQFQFIQLFPKLVEQSDLSDDEDKGTFICRQKK